MNCKTLFISLLIIFSSTNAFNQENTFSRVDEHARQTPSSKSRSVEELAAHLTNTFDDDKEKVRAIYVWIAENIKYNHRAIAPKNNISIEKLIRKEQSDQVLKSKKAVCEGYANLFKSLCDEAGIGCGIVTGITKLENGKLAPTGHAWNVVRVNDQWFPVDVTWGSGGLTEGRQRYVKDFQEVFFLGDPQFFIQDHFPNDPVYQLLDEPVRYADFIAGKSVEIPVQSAEVTSFPNINDTIDHLLRLPEKEQTLHSCRRTLRFQPDNGTANFTVAEYHFKRALSIWNDYQQETSKLFETRTPLTREILQEWRSRVDEFNRELDRADHLLSNIKSRDPAYSAKKQAAASLRDTRKLSRIAQDQFSDFEKMIQRN